MQKFYIIFILAFFILPLTVKAQTGCATIQSVTSSVNEIQADTPFTCNVAVDSAHAGSSTIACGISFDGKYPENFCPSDTNFGGWQGSLATFNCQITQSILSSQHSSTELVAFDFRPECGLTYASRKSITAANSNGTPAPNETITPENATQPASNETPIAPNTNGGIGQGTVPNPPSKPATSVTQLLGTTSQYPTNIVNLARTCMANKDIYEQASQATGVPWQVLAGIHYREGDCNRNKSLVSGRDIGSNEPDLQGNCSSKITGPGKPYPIRGGCAFHSILDTAIYSGNHLKGKIGAVPATVPQLVVALSRYNGGGNRNCGKTPYSSCPPLYPGEDDTYVMNLYDSRHNRMFVVYCADYTLCQPPKIDARPGTLTISNAMSSL